MPQRKNLAVVCRFVEEVYNKGNLAALNEVVAPNVICHPPLPDCTPGCIGINQTIACLRGAFPDLQVTVEELIAVDDAVIAKETFCGTHLGSFMSVQPTGLPVKWTRVVFYHLANSKIVERWSEIEALGMLQQLELAAFPEQVVVSPAVRSDSRRAVGS